MKNFLYGATTTLLLFALFGFGKPKEYVVVHRGNVFSGINDTKVLNDYAKQGYCVKFAVYDNALGAMRVIMER